MRGPWYCDYCGEKAHYRYQLRFRSIESHWYSWWSHWIYNSSYTKEFCAKCSENLDDMFEKFKAPPPTNLEQLMKLKRLSSL